MIGLYIYIYIFEMFISTESKPGVSVPATVNGGTKGDMEVYHNGQPKDLPFVMTTSFSVLNVFLKTVID